MSGGRSRCRLTQRRRKGRSERHTVVHRSAEQRRRGVRTSGQPLSRYTQNAPKMLGYMSVLGTPVLSALSNRFKADIGREGTAGKPLPRHPLVAVQREQPASGEASDRLPGQPRRSRSE
jgi:hypothetical protein